MDKILLHENQELKMQITQHSKMIYQLLEELNEVELRLLNNLALSFFLSHS